MPLGIAPDVPEFHSYAHVLQLQANHVHVALAQKQRCLKTPMPQEKKGSRLKEISRSIGIKKLW